MPTGPAKQGRGGRCLLLGSPSCLTKLSGRLEDSSVKGSSIPSTHEAVTTVPGIRCRLLASVGSRHTHRTQTYMQSKYSHHKLK